MPWARLRQQEAEAQVITKPAAAAQRSNRWVAKGNWIFAPRKIPRCYTPHVFGGDGHLKLEFLRVLWLASVEGPNESISFVTFVGLGTLGARRASLCVARQRPGSRRREWRACRPRLARL